MERAYKRKCFRGRGIVARWLDRVFFSALGGVCLYILRGGLVLSLLLFGAIVFLLVLWDMRRWSGFRQKLWQDTVTQLKREDWLIREAERIREAGGVILHPSPETERPMGQCLRLGRGTAFHCFGDVREELAATAEPFGCTVTFHPWGEGTEPSREQVLRRLERDMPRRKAKLWHRLVLLPGNRYLLAGGVLLLMSIFLRRALYWRLLGSLCLGIGALHRSFHFLAET